MRSQTISSISALFCCLTLLVSACQSSEAAMERSSISQAIESQTSRPAVAGQLDGQDVNQENPDRAQIDGESAPSAANRGVPGAKTDPQAEVPAPAPVEEPADFQAAGGPLRSASAQESAIANGILNPAVLERPLSDIMPSLFVSDTAELEALSELLRKTAPPVEPVPIAALWQAAPPVTPIESWRNTENYLILGTDRRPSWDIWRTDVIMVVGLDRAQHRAAVFSIPRDTYVPIPGHGWDRINTADIIGERSLNVEGGGPALVATVISNTFGVPTQHWVRVDMDGFEELIDAVDGVTIHLKCPFYEPILNLNTGGWTYLSLPPGDVTLDGETAHWYARLRLQESDIGRARRQRQLLWALRDKMLSANLIVRLPLLWSALQGKFSTDLTLLDLVDLAQWGLPLNASRIHTGALTTRELQPWTTPAGGAVLRIVDMNLVQNTIDSVWTGTLMANAVEPENGVCPPLPPGAPAFPAPTAESE